MTHFSFNRAPNAQRIVSDRDVSDKVKDKLRNLLWRFFMRQMPQSRKSQNARIRNPR